jgi:hypothetical protein
VIIVSDNRHFGTEGQNRPYPLRYRYSSSPPVRDGFARSIAAILACAARTLAARLALATAFCKP